MVMMMVPVLWILLQQVTLAAPGTPVGDGPVLRRQLRVLKAFIEGLDFMVMAPNNGVIVDRRIRPAPGEPAEARATVQALVEIGTAYAIHVAGGAQAELTLDFPAGAYAAEWVNTKTGEVAKAETFDHAGGRRTLASPAYAEDIVVRVKRTRQGPMNVRSIRQSIRGGCPHRLLAGPTRHGRLPEAALNAPRWSHA